jgi:hypothetical protein
MPVTHLLYLHGFRSSPLSAKAQKVAARVQARNPGVTWWCPQLPPSPRQAMDGVMQGIAGWPRASMAVIGSSLGGFYATWVAQQTGCPAVLLNPAVDPARDLAAYIGEQTQMYALFEDAGKFLAGRVMSEAESSMQIELDSGKRVKVKAANVLLKFDKPVPAELLAEGQRLAAEMDLDLAWEFAPAEEFGFADLARDYFDAKAGVAQQAAALFGLFGAPHYFRRMGRGLFRKAPEEQVKAALLGIERKAQVVAQIEAWAGELVAGQCPAPVREQLYKILFKPDKNGPEYKAVVEAAKRAQRAPLDLLLAAGAIDSPYQFHWRRFLFEQFPKGSGLPGRPGCAGGQGRTAAGGGACLLDRRLGHHRDRRRPVPAGPGQRHGDAGHPHRCTGPGDCARFGAGQGGARPPVHRLHAGLEAHHAARRGGADLHADGGARLPCRVAVRAHRRGHAGDPGQ